ncbi:MAG TPA: DUF2723 domain-containing protein [Gemmatimonadales bacterium]|nr:DUF2723 domain-containing protein [Gemmatimonadales bacterium]
MTNAQTEPREPPPYLWAGVTALVVFLIYLATLAPTTAFWDTSEYIAAAYSLGIPHPPGNPLFVVLAHTFGALPLSESYAARINLFAALTSALSAGLWFLVADRWMREVVTVRWARLAAAFAGVLVSATMWTVWNQTTVNEKVYTVSLLSTALVMWLGVHWADDAPGSHRDRWLVLIAYIIALSSCNHMMGVLAGPAVAIYVLLTDPAMVLRPWVLAMGLTLALAVSGKWSVIHDGPIEQQVAVLGMIAAVLAYTAWRDPGEFKRPILYLSVLAVVVGISLNYVFLPIRAAQFPPINEGEPTTWTALNEVLNRAQYGKPSVFLRQADFLSQIKNYLQYLNWQFARDWGRAAGIATGIFTATGLIGAWSLWQRDRRAFWASAGLMFTLTLLLIFYLNFKYGFSIPVDPSRGDVAREVRERDYFFVVSFAAFGLWVAVGIGALMRGVADFFRDRVPEKQTWIYSTPVLLLGIVPLLGNHVTASRAHESAARDFASDLLQSVEPYGILITAGDNDTFPLWFAQEVEGIRPDVTLANLSLMNTRWHLRQLKRRVTPEFDPAKAADLWKNGTWVRPTEPVFRLTEGQLDSLPELQQVPKNGGIRFDSLEIAFGSEYLQLSDLATIFLIRDNVGQRPIFFAWSAGGYPDQTLGLTPYLITQGLVRKLVMTPVVPKDSVILTRGLGYANLPRTEKLMWDTYHFSTVARNRPRGWVDRPSSSILSLYGVVYGTMANTLRSEGDSTQADRADSVANAVRANLAGEQ